MELQGQLNDERSMRSTARQTDWEKQVLALYRNLHDDTLNATVQCTSCKLLTNIVEVIFKDRSDLRTLEQRRALLAKILSTSVSKLSVLKKSLPSFMTPSESDP